MLDSIRTHRKLGQDMCNSPRHLFIYGDSGVGKSMMLKKYKNKYPTFMDIDSEGTEYDIVPVVYMEIPEPYTHVEFYSTLIESLGAVIPTGNSRIGDLKRRAFSLMKQQRVEMVIIDEIGYIKEQRYFKEMEAMNTIKHLANIANVSVVIVGTPETASLHKMNFQFFRRYPPLQITHFASCDEGFCDLLNEIETQISPPEKLGLGDLETGFPQLLHVLSKGFVGLLTPIITEAYSLLGVFESDFEDITKARLTVKILKEAYYNTLGTDLTHDEFMKILSKDQL